MQFVTAGRRFFLFPEGNTAATGICAVAIFIIFFFAELFAAPMSCLLYKCVCVCFFEAVCHCI